MPGRGPTIHAFPLRIRIGERENEVIIHLNTCQAPSWPETGISPEDSSCSTFAGILVFRRQQLALQEPSPAAHTLQVRETGVERETDRQMFVNILPSRQPYLAVRDTMASILVYYGLAHDYTETHATQGLSSWGSLMVRKQSNVYVAATIVF